MVLWLRRCGSQQSSAHAEPKLLMKRVWHGWCVTLVVLRFPAQSTRSSPISTDQLYGALLMVWSGGCGSRRAAKSRGAPLPMQATCCRSRAILGCPGVAVIYPLCYAPLKAEAYF